MWTIAATDPLAMLAILVGVPALVILVIAAIVVGPRWGSAGRWRAGQPWPDAPLVFGAAAPHALPPGEAAQAAALEASREAASGGEPAVPPGIADFEVAAGAGVNEARTSSAVGSSANESSPTEALGGAHGTW
jgi:hypothetical protein